MTSEARLYHRDALASYSLHPLWSSFATSPASTHVPPTLLSFCPPKNGTSRVIAMAIKRSPKRLKYSAPRFTKDDGLRYIESDPSGSDSWKMETVVELLKEGAVGVIPTDTLYVMACHMRSHSAIERLHRIKNIEASKPLSILCHSLRDIDKYTTGFPSGDGHGHANIFKAVKQCLPGPYTFILTASKALPKQCTRYGTTAAKYASRKNVGVHMPDDAICQAILEKMDAPLICASVKCPKVNDWMIDPQMIADTYGPELGVKSHPPIPMILLRPAQRGGLNFVVDGGVRVAEPSTVVDMTKVPPRVIRQGKGPMLHWMAIEDDEENASLEVIPSAV